MAVKAPKSYTAKKPFFCDKEIIFRGSGRARVFTISSKIQLVTVFLIVFSAVWSSYFYYMYNRSGRIINKKNNELVATQDAYVDLMSDFVTLQNNISSMIDSLDKSEKTDIDMVQYKQQAAVVEDKVKQITTQKKWIDADKLEEKASLTEVSLQRDIALSERDEMRRQLVNMQDMLEDIKKAEVEILDRVSRIANSEISKIKSAVAAINLPLKKKGLFFNLFANDKRKAGSGGPYIPADNKFLQQNNLNGKVSELFKNIDDLEYYNQILANVPLGKPVWSIWTTSHYGSRSDPFKKTKATHKGVDFAGRTGNKVKTVAKGKVIEAKYSNGYGNLVVLDHGNGFKTKYAHLNKIYVKKGQQLEINDVVGELGNTGRSTGPHLHYEVLYQGKDVDPMPFVKTKL